MPDVGAGGISFAPLQCHLPEASAEPGARECFLLQCLLSKRWKQGARGT